MSQGGESTLVPLRGSIGIGGALRQPTAVEVPGGRRRSEVRFSIPRGDSAMSVEVAGGLEKLKTNHRPRVGRGDEIARGVPDREIGRLGGGGAWGGWGDWAWVGWRNCVAWRRDDMICGS